jgi:cytochrome P450
MSETHGPLVRVRLGPTVAHLVFDPADVKHVLVDANANYTKQTARTKQLRHLFGNGLVVSEGAYWRRQRRIAQPAFHRERLQGFATKMEGAADAMVARWRALPPDSTVDLGFEMSRATLQIVSETLLSTRTDADADVVSASVRHLSSYFGQRVARIVNVPLSLPTPNNLRAREAFAALDRVVYRIIAERRRTGEDAGDLLSMMMNVTDADTGEKMTDREVRDEVMTFFLAGHETTANALTWTWVLLSKFPLVRERVAAEARRVLADGPVGLASVQRLEVCRAVVEEVMRLYPPAWALFRHVVEGDRIRGHLIPKGSLVLMSPYVTHRLEAYWPNPEGFDPERFTSAQSRERPRFAYFPFGGGPRQCIGNAFALMEAQIVVAKIAAEWWPDLVPGHDVVPDAKIVLRPSGEVRVKLRRIC